MKDRLKKKLKAMKLRQQSSPPLGRNLPEQYKKYFEALNSVTSGGEPSGDGDTVSAMLDKGMEATEKLFIIIKHQMPHLFKEFEKTVVRDFTDEEKQEFYDKIAHLEATQLDEILGGK
jgi:hypothetical protein